MERYLYAFLALGFFFPALVTAKFRPDLRPALVQAGAVGAAVELVSEFWYTADYWKPPWLLGIPGPEDVVYGFGATAMAVSIYAVVFRWTYANFRDDPVTPRGAWGRAGVYLAGYAAVMELAHLAGSPSIWVATGYFLVAGLTVHANRTSLVWPAVATGLLMGLVAFVYFGVGLNLHTMGVTPIISGDAYLRSVYLLYHTRLDIRLAGVPVDEICWNIARGWAVVSVYAYVTGQEFSDYRHPPDR